MSTSNNSLNFRAECVAFLLFTLHISGNIVVSQFDRKFDLLHLCNHETIDGLIVHQQQYFIHEEFIVT